MKLLGFDSHRHANPVFVIVGFLVCNIPHELVDGLLGGGGVVKTCQCLGDLVLVSNVRAERHRSNWSICWRRHMLLLLFRNNTSYLF